MKPKLLIPSVAAAAACALGVLPVGSAAAATTAQPAASANWSGYVVTPASESTGRFRSVSGSWTVPAASCTSGSGYSSFWVGLGGSAASASGSGQPALEQAGTEVDCSASSAPSEFAWYELVPSAPVRIAMPVHPGDHISTRVTVSGSQVAIAMTNQTTGGSFARTLKMSNPDTSSAEWVAEAPSSCQGSMDNCTPLPLADFGKVAFSSASATTTSGHTGSISDPAFSATALTLAPGASSLGGAGDIAYAVGGSGGGAAIPSGLSSDGTSFSVAWQDPSGAASASSSGAGGGWSDPYGAGGGYGAGSGYGYGGDGGPGGYGDGGGPYAIIIGI